MEGLSGGGREACLGLMSALQLRKSAASTVPIVGFWAPRVCPLSPGPAVLLVAEASLLSSSLPLGSQHCPLKSVGEQDPGKDIHGEGGGREECFKPGAPERW